MSLTRLGWFCSTCTRSRSTMVIVHEMNCSGELGRIKRKGSRVFFLLLFFLEREHNFEADVSMNWKVKGGR